MNDDQLCAIAGKFVNICRNAGVLSIINDRVDIAVCAGADGVHLGQNDLSVSQAGKLQLQPLIIGKSTHSISQLRNALDEQPTYVALGPVFTTATKPEAKPVGLEYVKQAIPLLESTAVAAVAIGGINLENIEQVLQAGARTIVVYSAVANADQPGQICRQLKEKISAY